MFSKTSDQGGAAPAGVQKRRSRWHVVGIILLILVLVLIAVRLALPGMVRNYVNRTLDQSQLYKGKIGDVDLHLWRGAYSIHDLTLAKITGDVPVPLYSAKRVDFQLEWSALWHRKLVGQVIMEEPELNFVDAPSDAESQTGAGGPWLQIIRDLFPFQINSARVRNGAIHFRTFQTGRPVDVYLTRLEADVDNLTNIQNDVTPMITTVKAHATAMDQADFDYQMKLDPFSYRPTFHMATRLLGLDVTKINNLALSYGQFDFKNGSLDLVIEVDAKEGQMEGYVKPLFRGLHVFSLGQDVRKDPLRFFWQALLGGTVQVFKNQPRDQFGTLIPFTSDLTTNRPDILGTIGNVLRNAFVRAYLPRLETSPDQAAGLNFGAPSPIESTSIGGK
jgi:hypothetical protein